MPKNHIPERINKDLIRKGLENNLITFQIKYNNLAVKIGDFWFYISSEHDRTEKDYTKEQLVDMIYESINSEPINDADEEQATECLYYKCFLEEKLKLT